MTRDAAFLRRAVAASLLLHALLLGLFLTLPGRRPTEPVRLYTVRILEVPPDDAASGAGTPAPARAALATQANLAASASAPTAAAPHELALAPAPPLAAALATEPARPFLAAAAPAERLPASDPVPSATAAAAAPTAAAITASDSAAEPAPAASAGVTAAASDGAPDAIPARETLPGSAASAARRVDVQALDAGFRLVAPVRPLYPQAALRVRRPGTVHLELEVAPDGRVTALAAEEEPSGWGFAEAARAAYVQARFSAPTVNGEPVRVRWRRVLHFRP